MPTILLPMSELPKPPPVPKNIKQQLLTKYTYKNNNDNQNNNHYNNTVDTIHNNVKTESNNNTTTNNDTDIDTITNNLNNLNIQHNQQSDNIDNNSIYQPDCLNQYTWLYDQQQSCYTIVHKSDQQPVYVPNKQDKCYRLYKYYRLPSTIYDKLYPHQRECLLWLYNIHCDKLCNYSAGCVLADDMGLGKTVQLSSYICGLFYSKLVSRILVVLPVAVCADWEEKLNLYNTYNNNSNNTTSSTNKLQQPIKCPVRIVNFDGSRHKRNEQLQRVIEFGGICITTYGKLTNSIELFNHDKIQWDYIICDEGHKLKNPNTQLSLTLHQVKARHRVILTGSMYN